MLMMPLVGMSGKQGFLVSTLTLAANYTSTQAGALAEAILTFKTDGTWAYTVGAGDSSGGTPTTGTWLLSGGAAADYEILYTPSGGVNSPTIVNDASSYTAVSANRAFTVSKNSADASSDVLVSIRRITDTSEIVSQSTNLAAEGA